MIQELPMLSFPEALKEAGNKVLQFTGHSRRSEYWWTQLLVYGLSLILTPFAGAVLDLFTIPLTFRRLHDIGRSGWWVGGLLILKAGFILMIIADLIVVIATDGDVPWSVWGFIAKYWLFFTVILIYQIALIIMCCVDSEKFTNQYGSSPKYVEVDETNESM